MADFDVAVDDEHRIIRLTVRGDVTKEDARRFIPAARKSTREKGYNILCDFRDARSALELADIYYLPRRSEELRDLDARTFRVAELPGTPRRLWEFCDTVLTNLGFTHKLFDSEEDAIEWLTAAKENVPADKT